MATAQDKARRGAKRKPSRQEVGNDNQAVTADDEEPRPTRGDALTRGGNKIHGDELEGMIPGRPSRPHTGRESE